MKNRRSLRRILTLAWLVPAGISIALSVAAFLILGWTDHKNALEREVSDLDTKSLTVARRLAAEVLLGEQGSPASVSGVLKSELGMSGISITKSVNECSPEELRSNGYCVRRDGSTLSLIRPLPLVQDPTFVRVFARAPSYKDSLNLTLLLWSVIPIISLLGMGIFALRRLHERYVLQPVEALADAASCGGEPPEFWPAELAQLSTDLREAFLKRDLAMVGQMASGVIHDLKTLLHSSWTATELVEEQPLGSEKRQRRLEALHWVARTNFPKMEALIQTTLDGSREIRVNPSSGDLNQTLDHSLSSIRDFASRCEVQVTIEKESYLDAARHDPVQMERVFTNLLKNAVEAAAEGESKPSRVLVRTICTAGGARILIDDSGRGLGVDPKNILRSVRSTKIHGTGLGLVISRKIIEAHSGRLLPGKSEELGGARFEVFIPQQEEMA